jgi:hypothetical protein
MAHTLDAVSGSAESGSTSEQWQKPATVQGGVPTPSQIKTATSS